MPFKSIINSSGCDLVIRKILKFVLKLFVRGFRSWLWTRGSQFEWTRLGSHSINENLIFQYVDDQIFSHKIGCTRFFQCELHSSNMYKFHCTKIFSIKKFHFFRLCIICKTFQTKCNNLYGIWEFNLCCLCMNVLWGTRVASQRDFLHNNEILRGRFLRL